MQPGGEEIVPDDDSFDYIFYTYGLEHYKNMPLIEALEYKDVKKIDEFVIAIDTSESCPPETVRLFLEETFGMLSDRESFFKKINVHIVQCDAGIASDTVITDRDEFLQFMEDFDVSGFEAQTFVRCLIIRPGLLKKDSLSTLKG